MIHCKVEGDAVGKHDIGKGECLEVETAVMNESNLFGGEAGVGNNRVHEITVMETLEGLKVGVVKLDGAVDGV